MSSLFENQFTLELGSERGSASQGISNCIRTDLEPYKGLDVICDANSLPFRDKIFDRTWAVYLAHHLVDIRILISEARRVSDKFYMFDFLPNSWLHYYSVIWDWLIFSTSIKAVDPYLLKKIVPTYRSYKQSHLGSVLYVF
ncbi:MAG: methyltransferase domain-containing protein [Candidatus Hermodarchaeia archaeon]